MIRIVVSTQDGYELQASKLTWVDTILYLKQLAHIVMCDRHLCVRGYHNTRKTPRPITIVLSSAEEPDELLQWYATAKSEGRNEPIIGPVRSHGLRNIAGGEEPVREGEAGYQTVLHWGDE